MKRECGIFMVWNPKGEKVGKYKDGVVNFAKEHGLREGHIYEVLNGKENRKTVQGWRFAWVTKPKKPDVARKLRVTNIETGESFVVEGIKRLCKDWEGFDTKSVRAVVNGKMRKTNGCMIEEI